MDRDELILSCRDLVNNLVRKYNNHVLDEDLINEGMIAVIECVDRCLVDGMEDLGQIQARCNIWVRNRLLDIIYKQRVKFDDDTEVDELYVNDEDEKCLVEVAELLTEREKEVFDLLLKGADNEDIQRELGISLKCVQKHKTSIRKKITKSMVGK